MKYILTLTSEDRKAIDWIGHRYPHGNNTGWNDVGQSRQVIRQWALETFERRVSK